MKFYLNMVPLMIPQRVKQSVGVCNCVLFIIDIALSLSMNCLLSTLRNTSTFSISIYIFIFLLKYSFAASLLNFYQQ